MAKIITDLKVEEGKIITTTLEKRPERTDNGEGPRCPRISKEHLNNVLASFEAVLAENGLCELDNEEFYVERHFLAAYGDDIITIADPYAGTIFQQYDCTYVQVLTSPIAPAPEDEATCLTFCYYNSDGQDTLANGHALAIYNADLSTLYERKVGQNPRTEYEMNELEDDFVDYDDNLVFPAKN